MDKTLKMTIGAPTSRPGFVHGLVFGIMISFLFVYITSYHIVASQQKQMVESNYIRSFMMTSNSQRDDTVQGNLKKLDDGSKKVKLDFDDTHFHNDNYSISKDLEKRVRVLCWIMTGPQNLETKAIHVKNTWGKRCNILLFMSSVQNDTFPTVGLDVPEGREHLTGKTMQAFRYVYEHYRDQADWFLKADDDTYIIMENLRYFLKDYKTTDPIYFGHRFKVFVKQGYFSGGAGYVLSRESLNRVATLGNNNNLCRQDGGPEDVEIGVCMERLGVKALNSTDALGRNRFHCFNPESHLFGEYPSWYYRYDANGSRKGLKSISDYAISFHYVVPNLMYALEFYVYHLRPYGIESGHQHLNVHVQNGNSLSHPGR